MTALGRNLTDTVRESLQDSRAVFLQGARQTGKSTLARALCDDTAAYLTLDDSAVLSAALSDPDGFVAGLPDRVAIDEVQRAPGLALAIKSVVDRDRRPGRFLLTGSADFMVLPQLADSLAGRMEIHTLWPFSQGELSGARDTFIDAVFGKRFAPAGFTPEPWSKLTDRLVRGGYPEMLHRSEFARRGAWFESYIVSILQRDVRDISNVRDLGEMPRLLALIASRACGLLDYADLARGLSMPQTTLKRYMGLLEATFLVRTLPAWSIDIGKRLVKAPKLLMNDTGLLTHLLGMDANRLKSDSMAGGAILENFVVTEVCKQRGWSKGRPDLFHFRSYAGDEVDIVLEDKAGRIVGIEVKASATIGANHFKGLKLLAEAAGERFVRGILLYTGANAVPFAKNLFALPVPVLWS
jgi:hypothetical protein